MLFAVLQYTYERVVLHKIFHLSEYAMVYAKKLAMDDYNQDTMDGVNNVVEQEKNEIMENAIITYTMIHNHRDSMEFYSVVRMDGKVDDGNDDVLKWMMEGTVTLDE